jgi:hypothetical protein
MKIMEAVETADKRIEAGFSELPTEENEEMVVRALFTGLDIDYDEVHQAMGYWLLRIKVSSELGASPKEVLSGVLHAALLTGLLAGSQDG